MLSQKPSKKNDKRRAKALTKITNIGRRRREEVSAASLQPSPLLRLQTRTEANLFSALSHVLDLCSKNHELDSCPDFKKKPLDERKEFVKKGSVCFGCLLLVTYPRDVKPERLASPT